MVELGPARSVSDRYEGWPLFILGGGEHAVITSRFLQHESWRPYPHTGVDLAVMRGGVAVAGTAIRAPAPGVVEYKWPGNLAPAVGMGYWVKLLHDDGTRTGYLHMETASPIARGQRVARGDIIGNVGATGGNWRPHLHFMLYPPGIALAPRDAQGDPVASALLNPLDYLSVQPDEPHPLGAIKGAQAAFFGANEMQGYALHWAGFAVVNGQRVGEYRLLVPANRVPGGR